jgi:Flp pilus assembly protein TadD
VLNDARHFAAAADKLRRAEQAAPGDPRAPALAVSLAGLGDAAGAAAAKQRAAELVQRHSRR